MWSALKLRASIPVIELGFTPSPTGNTKFLRYPYNLRLRARSTRSLCTRSQYDAAEPSVPSQFTASVGNPSSPPSFVLPQWNLTHRHIVVLNVFACAVAVSATWLFCSAIPTLLAFKKAAESLEKLMDVMREELPDTMAAVRLSGMEISDLTMELSDLGQEITTGVRSSTRAVQVAEEKLRHMANMSPSASMQEVANPKNEPSGPLLARTARGIRTSIVKGRGVLQTFFTFIRFSRMVQNYFSKRRAKRLVG